MTDKTDFDGVPSFAELNPEEWYLDQTDRLDADMPPSFGLEARVLELRQASAVARALRPAVVLAEQPVEDETITGLGHKLAVLHDLTRDHPHYAMISDVLDTIAESHN